MIEDLFLAFWDEGRMDLCRNTPHKKDPDIIGLAFAACLGLASDDRLFRG